MPAEKAESERSKLKERMKNLWNLRNYREEVAHDREDAKLGMKLLRIGEIAKEDEPDKRDENWYDKILVRSKAKMREKRSKQTEDDKNEERRKLRDRMRESRARKSRDEIDREN